MFYYDEKIEELEKDKQFIQIIDYLENLYNNKMSVNLLCSLIGYSWFFFVEGPCLKSDICENDLEKLKKTWEKYLKFGIKNFQDNDQVIFIIGYTFSLHGFFYPRYIGERGNRIAICEKM